MSDNLSLDGLVIEAIDRRTFDTLLMEATTTVERELAIEDKGWVNLTLSGAEISSPKRIENIKQSRIYYNFDPLVKQAIRLWTDYTFGLGMSWSVDEGNQQTQKILEDFFYSKANQPIFGSRGQRKCSDKLLVDGEIFFAFFLGKESTIRTIDPLEITEIISDPDDIEHPMFYKREWTDRQNKSHTDYYRSHLNPQNKSTKDSLGANHQKTQDALIYHLAINTIGQRGNPMGLSGFDWLKQYRRFLAARVAMMLARTRWAWRQKIKGGQSALDSVKAATQDKTPVAGSSLIENEAVDTQPIQTPQDAKNAYDDARLLKLQLCSAFGIPEQYFGDIATGNLATAKTVELPMLKMFQSYQAIWSDTFQDIFEIVFEYNKIPKDKWYVDKDFPAIAPEDAMAAAQAISQIIMAFPEFASISDVQQTALMAIGINDPAVVLEQLSKEAKSDPAIPLAKALREFKKLLEAKK